MVAAKVAPAAEAGAQVLEAGGNAVDAAAAAAFASGVSEPYMSGLGGGGFILIYLADRDEVISIDCSMTAPEAAHDRMFELLDDGSRDEFFGWRAVRDAENLEGYRSIGVPGSLAGLATAVERYGRLSLADVMQPAIALARDGFEVSWMDTLMIAQHQQVLGRFEASRTTFLPGGHVPVSGPGSAPLIRQPRLAETMESIATDGPDAFYGGAVGESLVRDVQAGGGLLTHHDLANYRVTIDEHVPLASYRGARIGIPHAACGSTTVLQALRLLDGFAFDRIGHNSGAMLDIVAQASKLAFADRFEYLGAFTESVSGLELLGDEYIEDRRKLVRPGTAGPVAPGTARAAGRGVGGSTTHMSAVDGDGNLVTTTQTLLQLFGSGVVTNDTGVVLNNAMAWYDPEPGRAASIAANKRPLTNMSPVMVLGSGGRRLAAGASGGRKIMQAVQQIIQNWVDYELPLQDAVAAPRIDCSGPQVLANSRLSGDAIDELRVAGHEVDVVSDSFTTRPFASPACVAINTDGQRQAGLDPYYPASAAGSE